MLRKLVGDLLRVIDKVVRGGAVKLLWTDHKKFADQKSAVLACLHAGINQFLDTCKDQTAAGVKEGSVSEAEIDGLPRSTSVIWLKLGLLDPTHMAHASQDEGTAIAKVLFGDDNPGGHLVTTWPMSIDQLPPMLDDNIRDGRTYMYFKSKPLYAFGYRLSYTT